eukprot:1511353-Pleurochrysis_carterae.AAC.1
MTFATTCPGAIKANMTWLSLPTALTGLRSVSPRARTARTEMRHDSTSAVAVCQTGIANIGEITASANADEASSPLSHMGAGTSCDLGATSNRSWPFSTPSSLRRCAATNGPMCCMRMILNAVSASASMSGSATHRTQPCAPNSHESTAPLGTSASHDGCEPGDAGGGGGSATLGAAP